MVVNKTITMKRDTVMGSEGEEVASLECVRVFYAREAAGREGGWVILRKE